MPTTAVSVILPVFNEAANLEPLAKDVVAALEETGRSYEVIFVDDGSTDQSLAVLKTLQRTHPSVVVIEFRRNFGQTAALAAGLRAADGEIVITMDADRQNDPRDIAMLLKEIDQGMDLVCGWRHERKDGLWLRLLPSRVANWLISTTTDVKLHDYGCTLKAMRKDVAKNLRLYGEMHRFIPAIASWYGVRMSEVKVRHHARTAGVSKYGLSRTFRVLLDLLTVKFLMGYSARPIQFFGSIGMACTVAGGGILGWLFIERVFFDIALAGRPAVLAGIVLTLVGLQFVTVGLLAELQARTYHESQDKPTYEIRHTYGGREA
jgi:glycosyltransferase involved in cell wall biosynthesis|tara:strand:+ start:441 stop:1400 length:960 start_codon:yes stop_codon:yes gene_type:complete